MACDVEALVMGLTDAGLPKLVQPELAVFGFYVALAIVQLWLVPQTFLIHNLVTSIESLTEEHSESSM